MRTKTPSAQPPAGYDPSLFPAFAVTVDVVILTMVERTLNVLLVRRGQEPFEGMWAIPGGFKRPHETLDEAARRELAEETGVDVPSLLTQFGAYGDPGRDPRMNVVTVGYLAVLRDVGAIAAGTDAAEADLVPASDVLQGKLPLAFDHLRLVRDAIERVRVELEVSGIATAFVGTTFTMAELRAVYEAIWGVQLDAANFRRSIVSEDGWVIPTGRRTQPGPEGGRPAELFPRRAGVEPRRADPPAPAVEGAEFVKAVVHDRFGPPEVLRIEDVPAPVPKDDEVLVRVRATTVNQTDCHVRRAKPIVWRFMIGFFRPKWRTLGMEFAGEVEAVGSAVTEFAVGDRVFGMKNYGANAELVTVRESRLVAHLPEALSFEEGAAVIDGAYQGLVALRRGGVGKGARLLVYGASGSCGTACVQLGRHLGAHVTAVCGTKNVELMRSLGADVVIDYQHEDFRKGGEKYDVIIDAVGKIVGLRYRGSLVPGGMFVLTDGLWNVLGVLLTRWSSRRIVAAWPRYEKEDLHLLKRLLETGEYRAVIDRTYPLERVVEATTYVETWQKTGNVVLTLEGGRS